MIPCISRRCLTILALPFDSYEKCETVRHFFLTHRRHTHRSLLLSPLSLIRNPFAHHQATFTPRVLGGVAARSSSLNSSNGNVAISLGVGFSSRLSALLGGVWGGEPDKNEDWVESLDGQGDECSVNDVSEPFLPKIVSSVSGSILSVAVDNLSQSAE